MDVNIQFSVSEIFLYELGFPYLQLIKVDLVWTSKLSNQKKKIKFILLEQNKMIVLCSIFNKIAIFVFFFVFLVEYKNVVQYD